MKTTERLIWAAALAAALVSCHRDAPIDRIEMLRLHFRPVPDQVGPPTIPPARPAILTLRDIETEIERFDTVRATMIESPAKRADLEWVEGKQEALR